VQCAIVHAQLETIHPFNDGNGRVGRALVHVLLRRRGLATNFVAPVSVVLASKRPMYIEALTRFRAGDFETWIELFAVSLAQAAMLARSYLVDVRHLQQQWREMLTALSPAPRADAAAWLLLDHLPAHPVLTGPAAVASTGRSKPAVNQAIEQLVNAGILEPLSSGARNRSWEPVGLVDLIERVEPGA
jgi:Fic family protein